MKKFFAILFLGILLNTNLFASWEKIGKSVDGNISYIDIRTLKIVGDIRYIFILFDYAIPNSYGDLSSKTYRQINCKNFMFKDLVKDYFRYPLGKGEPTSGSGKIKDPKWNSFNSGSTGLAVIKRVCKL